MQNIIIIVSVLLVINALLLRFSVNSTTEDTALDSNNRDGTINENRIKGALPKGLQGYLKILNEDYVVGLQYLEGKTELLEPEWYVSRYDGKSKKTIGNQNTDYQTVEDTGLIHRKGKIIKESKAHDLDINTFVTSLELGLKGYNNKIKPFSGF